MTRSAEALERRARKRSRTVEEQQAAELEQAAKKTKQSTEEKQQMRRQEVQHVPVVVPNDDPLTEPGAWKCGACGNHNFASRYVCNSKTCNEARPESASNICIRQGGGGQQRTSVQSSHHLPRLQEGGQRGPRGNISSSSSKTTQTNTDRSSLDKTKKPIRHDPETSKLIDWTKPQASASLMEQNQQLRQRLRDGDPTLQGDELERARLLVARDERKQQKKAAAAKKSSKTKAQEEKSSSVDKTHATKVEKDVASETNGQEVTEKTSNARCLKLLAMREQQKANKKLLNKLQETQGEGLTESEQVKALEIHARKMNKLLMKTFEKTGGGKGMSPEDAARAKLLIERKARKREQRLLDGKRNNKSS